MITLQDAKNRFSAVVDAALAGRPQEVSRRGKPAVVVLSVEAYHRLLGEARAGRESFAEHLLAFPRKDRVKDPDGEMLRGAAAPRDVAF